MPELYVDTKTPEREYPVPDPANPLQVDMPRIALALNAISEEMQAVLGTLEPGTPTFKSLSDLKTQISDLATATTNADNALKATLYRNALFSVCGMEDIADLLTLAETAPPT